MRRPDHGRPRPGGWHRTARLELRVGRAARTTDRSLVAVCAEDDEARDLALELEAILGRAAVALYPSRGVPLAGPVGAAPHLVGLRARALASAERPATVVVAGAPALAELIAPRAIWAEPMNIVTGATSPIEEVLDRLAGLGYERTAQVEERGEIAVRGGLIDVYPSTADLPVRIEFFGDEIESVRAFSPFTQRTIRPLERVLVWPSTEPDAARPGAGRWTIRGWPRGTGAPRAGRASGRAAGRA